MSAATGDPVVVKVCLGLDGAGREAECRALARRPIAAMPQLLDLATSELGEPVLVMTLCRGRPLGSGATASGGRGFDAAALSSLVEELHGAGVAHGGLDPGAVLVDDDGALSLVGFRSARFAGEQGFEAAMGADLRAVARLAARPRVQPLVVSYPARPSRGRSAASLAVSPVLPAPGPSASASAGTFSSRDDGPADAWGWIDDTIDEPDGDPAFLETLEPAVLAIRESGAALRGLVRTRSAGAMAPRRRRLLAVGGSLVVAAAVAGCLLVPSGGSKASDGGSATSADRATNSAAPSAGSQGSANPSDQVGAAGSAAESDIRSDDPVRAVAALLEYRRDCVQEHQAGCLDAVDQWNSPAMLDDRELVRGNETGSENASGERNEPSSGLPSDPLESVTGLTLVDRIGATALLSGTIVDPEAPETTKPVSLLVMRGETGWRLRSYRVGQGPD